MNRPGRLRLGLAAVAFVGALAAVAGIPGPATPSSPVTGDEPHYLVTAVSIAEDASLDVADEYAAGARTIPFIAQRPQAHPEGDGRLVEPHDPLLPVLLAWPVRFGGLWGAKLTLAGMAGALAAGTAWLMVRRFAVTPSTALVVTGLFAASAPLAVYGHQVYPELPAALAATVGIATVTAPATGRRLLVLALAVVALPWLSVKYVPVAAVLAIAGLWRAWEWHGRGGAAILGATFAAAALVYAGLHVTWYGGVTVYAAGAFFAEHGGQESVLGTAPDFLGRTTRVLGLLVDRDFGLAAWQPAWLLAVPAIAALARTRSFGARVVLALVGVGWLGATFLAATMHGWWFPGRQVVVVLPALVVAIGVWVDGHVRRLRAFVVLGCVGIATYGLLAWQAARHRLTWVGDFASFDAPWSRAWRALLPDYRLLTAGTWIRHGLWIVLIATVVTIAWRAAGPAQSSLRGRRLGGRLLDARTGI